ncbi:hypothetical protein GUJ93_ZPchr0003g17505 [Zizania palustris]|uniref:Uncharacterized protein n=1 Tax=Zizania palustris TaxID=103762 RepID=A0A8J5SLE6_ZIZPA|nr:hypothetical protein GUJ93_ZPchr0003g17505 [Zizania palustris]
MRGAQTAGVKYSSVPLGLTTSLASAAACPDLSRRVLAGENHPSTRRLWWKSTVHAFKAARQLLYSP